MSEWKARVVDNLDTFIRDVVEFSIWRQRGDQIEYVSRIGGEHGTIAKTLAEGASLPADGKLVLPRGALDAIVDHLKPGPSTSELARLEEALSLERRRMDNVIATLLANTKSGR